MAKRAKRTRAAIGKQAFIRSARREFGVTAKVAREMARRYQERTGQAATGKAVREHPRITARLVKPSKAAVTRQGKMIVLDITLPEPKTLHASPPKRGKRR